MLAEISQVIQKHMTGIELANRLIASLYYYNDHFMLYDIQRAIDALVEYRASNKLGQNMNLEQTHKNIDQYLMMLREFDRYRQMVNEAKKEGMN
jgi:hypothetical protein